MGNTDHPLRRLLDPVNKPGVRWLAASVVPLLAVSAVLIVVAAGAMPAGYSWRIHSISESAAQGQEAAWIARLAFLCFGAAVLALSLAMRTNWARVTYWTNLAFAAFMFGAAAFSHKPWIPASPSDQFEDFLHSVCATGMGFAFCVAVVARFAQRGQHARLGRPLDALALIVATVMPLILASSSTAGGAVQRVMFAVAYVWFGHEALIALGLVRQKNGTQPSVQADSP